ncbi:MAG: ribonuclease III [Desulfobacterales bacterium]|nr:ribonuclease III [Desulfobacterales bacterium]
MEKNLSELEDKLGYVFRDKALLIRSLSHRSFVNEQSDSTLKDNERLEFLGDAVLNLVLSHILMEQFLDINEGHLSKMRAGLVNEKQLAYLAKQIDLGSFVKLGKGEIQTDGRKKKSILSDTLEAVIASVYLDGGINTAFKLIESLFSSILTLKSNQLIIKDYKSDLQELCQLKYKETPKYKMIEDIGPDHDKTFVIQVSVGNITTTGVGKSKKKAEQDAASKILELIKEKL